MKKQYKVYNTYGIAGESRHSTPELALKARNAREGEGWIAERISDGATVDNNGPDIVIGA